MAKGGSAPGRVAWSAGAASPPDSRTSRHLLDEERHAIGARHQVLLHHGRQSLAGHLLDQQASLGGGKAIQGDGGEMRPEAPGGVKLRPAGEHQQEPGGGDLVDEQAEQLERGGIEPVQVFDSEEHRVPRRFGEQLREEGVQGLLPLA